MNGYKMKKFILLLLIAMHVTPVNADIPQHIKSFTLEDLRTIADNTLKISVTVNDTDSSTPFSWNMAPSDIAIFYKTVETLHDRNEIMSNVDITDPVSGYQGLTINIVNKYGENIEPFKVFKGVLSYLDGQKISLDINRHLEYLIWGMNKSRKNQDLAWKMLPITSFHDCVKLGYKMVETSPRQCLMTNGDIFLDVGESVTQEALSIQNFSDCLVKGQAIINTFPRRCIAAGGHVYTEPPIIR
tara:strand:+ start:105990 stop:106718 length:729 start_codon:yes stop_codon:yes gene_type:complete